LLRVCICPCDAQGKQLGQDVFTTPSELLETRLDFVVKIPHARGLKWISEDSTRGVVCKYKFYTGASDLLGAQSIACVSLTPHMRRHKKEDHQGGGGIDRSRV
jgi:hypothetical protein